MLLDYLCCDEVNRDTLAEQYSAQLHQHPLELDNVPHEGLLLIDLDHALFAARPAAVEAAQRWLAAGCTVGIHTYFLEDPLLACLGRHPRLTVASTLDELLYRYRHLLAGNALLQAA
jgi:hypothetical protein